MARVKLLEQSVCELIAAGEVVERPASVVKELVENALDAGATKIEIELRRNGLSLIRVTDNGSGIERGDVATAFLRHATSKIQSADDLDAIGTLGFRGEALAAISAVSKVRVVTKTKNQPFATEYIIEGGREVSLEECGGVDGTTFYINDLFYNTPARMNFLKSDVGEGNAVQTLVSQLALSNPGVAFQLARDGKTAISTPGDGKLFSAIYDVLPKDVAENMFAVSGFENHIAVDGYVLKPGLARRSRSFQYIYVNGRFVKSRTCIAAVEEAYKGVILSGRYPAFVINVKMPLDKVDVNVHPAKTEVRFTNDKEIFHAIYKAVRDEVMSFSGSFEKQIGPTAETASLLSQKDKTAGALAAPAGLSDAGQPEIHAEQPRVTQHKALPFVGFAPENTKPPGESSPILRQEQPKYNYSFLDIEAEPNIHSPAQPAAETFAQVAVEPAEKRIRVVGEIYKTYIIAEYGDEVVLIDKHAAHERLLYEQMNHAQLHENRQILLAPVVVSLPLAEKQALLENTVLVEGIGFSVDDFGETEVAVREAPTYMPEKGIKGAVEEIAAALKNNNQQLEPDETLWLMHSTACRAAIKAGHNTSREELVKICEDILGESIPKFCPHGRPILSVLGKKEIEKRFGRIQ